MSVSFPGPAAGLLALFLALQVPLAAAQDEEEDFFEYNPAEEFGGTSSAASIADPLEPMNRVIFQVNDQLYRKVLKPVAVAYREVPRPARESVSNFLDNLRSPVSAINALLQFDGRNAGVEAARFVVNSTVGILGLFDPASEMNLIADEEDLGQTLGRWGLDHGFYLVMPLAGPSSLRDAVGAAGNVAMDPVIGNLESGEVVGLRVLEAETDLSLDSDTYESLYDSALDPYTFFRSAYVQNRAGEVNR